MSLLYLVGRGIRLARRRGARRTRHRELHVLEGRSRVERPVPRCRRGARLGGGCLARRRGRSRRGGHHRPAEVQRKRGTGDRRTK